MFNDSIITKSSPIYKFLIELGLSLYLISPQLKNMVLFMSSMVCRGYTGKVTDIAEIIPTKHRTTIGRFLSKSTWNEDYIERALRKQVLNKI